MEPVEKSKYSKLYKTLHNGEERQENRRKFLLSEQKRLRSKAQDDARGLDSFSERIRKIRNRRRTYQQKYDEEHQLQLSEWLRERPNDLDQWFLVPCPKGQRCLVIATGGSTEVYRKDGRFIKQFHSDLPGDSTNRQQVTILDCISDKSQKKFFVLDSMAYGSHDLVNCEAQFRFFWITSKLTELKLSSGCEYEFIQLQYCDMADELAVAACLDWYPQFENNSPELDGFLFYHKEASYTYGTTPLVGWLFGFMIPEVLNLDVHPKYMEARPVDYMDYLHYMTTFDEALLKRRMKKIKTRRSGGKMDEDPPPECDVGDLQDIIEREKKLELEDLIEIS